VNKLIPERQNLFLEAKEKRPPQSAASHLGHNNPVLGTSALGTFGKSIHRRFGCVQQFMWILNALSAAVTLRY
jgi:hypothetical protein